MNSGYEIPDVANPSIKKVNRIKRFYLYLHATDPNNPKNINFVLLPFSTDDSKDDGIKVKDKDEMKLKIQEILGKDPNPSRLVPTPTQLDFGISKRTCVVIKLVGEFWEFSQDHPAVTTKRSYPDNMFCRLRHYRDQKGICRAISFFVNRVVMDNRDGFNLHVDFVEGKYRLPVTLDPDIENKGDDPP